MAFVGCTPAILRPFAVAINPTTWNPADKNANVALSNNNLTATGASSDVAKYVRATSGRTAGKLYFEVLPDVNNTSKFATVGIGTITSVAGNNPEYPGFDAGSVGYFSNNGSYYSGGSVVGQGTSYTTQIIGVAVDLGARLVWFSRAGVFTGNPAAGTGGLTIPNGPMYSICGVYNAGSVTLNAGASAFASAPPSSFSPWI